MNQAQRILKSKAPVHTIGGRKYKGQNPVYAPVTNELGIITGYRKVQAGIPFVRAS